MKIIDLLNKIANSEEVPKKIKVLGYTFIYTGEKSPQRFYKLENQNNYLLRDFVYTLDTEVKIIEEEKGIPDKIRWHEVNGVGEEDDEFYVDVNGKSQYVDSEYDSWEMTTILKINEIIDYLNSKGDKQ